MSGIFGSCNPIGDAEDLTVAQTNAILGNLKTCADIPHEIGNNIPTCEEMDAAIAVAIDSVPTSAETIALLKNCAGVSHELNANIPSCDEMDAAIAAAVGAIPPNPTNAEIAAVFDDVGGVDLPPGANLVQDIDMYFKAGSRTTSIIPNVGAAAGAVSRSMLDKARDELHVRDFGAVGDGVTNDAPAIIAALAYGTLTSRPVLISEGVYLYQGNQPMLVDLAKTGLIGEGRVIIDCTQSTVVGAMIKVYNTNTYSALGDNWSLGNKNTVSGISFTSGRLSNVRDGILLGDPAGVGNTNQIKLSNLSFSGFATGLNFLSHTYRVSLENCVFIHSIYNAVRTLSSISDVFESMDFSNCSFLDGGALLFEATTGVFNFYSCSFDNTRVDLSGSATTLNFFGGHFENPGSGGVGYDGFIGVYGSSNTVHLMGTTWVFNQNFDVTIPPITGGGGYQSSSSVILDGVNLPSGGHLQFPAFVVGGMRVQAQNMLFFPLSGGITPVLSKQLNVVYNGDFEVTPANKQGWVDAPYGPVLTGASVVNTTAAYTGTYGIELTAPVNGGLHVKQSFKCSPGQYVSVSAKARGVSGDPAGGIYGHFQYNFINSIGTTIGSTVGNPITLSAGFGEKGSLMGRYAPVGTDSIEVLLNAQNGVTQPTVVYFDEIVVNIS